LVRDVFTFPDNVTKSHVTLGCEAGETGEIYRQKADGILGMGNNPGTFHGEVRGVQGVGECCRDCVGCWGWDGCLEETQGDAESLRLC
jgi:hypothetical protein